MANFRDINSASRNLNRVTDINLQPENRSALESVMVALVAGGRVQEGALVAQMIEKTSVQTDIASAIADLKTVIQGIKQPEPVEPGMKAANTVLADLQAENAALKAQLSGK
jgi:hypothetical protein